VAKLRSLLSGLCRMTVKPEVILSCREQLKPCFQPDCGCGSGFQSDGCESGHPDFRVMYV
jgi:hypothetical protein